MTNPAPTAPRFAPDADTANFGVLTVTAWEKRVAAHPDAGHLSRGQRQRLALKLHKRALRAEDVDLNKVLQHPDVTGEEAVGLYVRQPALDRDRQPYAHLRL